MRKRLADLSCRPPLTQISSSLKTKPGGTEEASSHDPSSEKRILISTHRSFGCGSTHDHLNITHNGIAQRSPAHPGYRIRSCAGQRPCYGCRHYGSADPLERYADCRLRA